MLCRSSLTNFYSSCNYVGGMRKSKGLRRYAKDRDVAGSSPYVVIEYFKLSNSLGLVCKASFPKATSGFKSITYRGALLSSRLHDIM
jgi:hypothetical protein